jgi:hypothetical protein
MNISKPFIERPVATSLLLKRISGLATRLLAHVLYFGNTLVLSEPKRG